MRLFSSTMKMAEVIHANYLLTPVVQRFGIPLGFGEKTVEEVCRQSGIDTAFFLAIVNAFSHENYFPDKTLQTFNVGMIVEYLKKTHHYYRSTQVPLIESLLTSFVKNNHSRRKDLLPVQKFFEEYKKELFAHLKREEQITFPYIAKVQKAYAAGTIGAKERKSLSRYSMEVYENEHDNIDEKLFDLKNILIKYVPEDVNQTLCNTIIFEIFRLEKDIQDHTRIETSVLMPLVAKMEEHLGVHSAKP